MWPSDYRTQEGHRLEPNEFQSWLEDCWKDGLEWVDKHARNPILVLNGDLVDGVHHKSTEVMSARFDDHVGALIHLVRPIAERSRATYVTLGTEAHTQTAEHAIAEALRAKKYRSFRAAHDVLNLDINGIEVEVMHHISTSSTPWTEASGHCSSLNARRAERARQGRSAPRVIVRGHRHRFGFWCDGAGLTVVTPSWQGLTRWAR